MKKMFTKRAAVLLAMLMLLSLGVVGLSFSAFAADETKTFKERVDWTVTNATLSDNELENLPDSDPNFATAIENAEANVTVPSTDAYALVKVPFTVPFGSSDWDNNKKLYIKFKAENITSVGAHINDFDGTNWGNLFCGNVLGEWNAKVSHSVTDGYEIVEISFGTFVTGFFTNNANAEFSQIALVVTASESNAVFHIAGMALADAQPIFKNDIVTRTDLEHGDWANTSGYYTVEKDAEVKIGEDGDPSQIKYVGTKITYEKAEANNYISMDITNYDSSKYPKLYLGFYLSADTSIYFQGGESGWDAVEDGKHTKTYKAGYNSIVIDLSGYDKNKYKLCMYLDSKDTTYTGDAKTVLIDYVRVFNDITMTGEVTTNNASLFAPDYKGNGNLEWSYESNGEPIEYYYVGIPVQNWVSFWRYLELDISLSATTNIVPYFSANPNGGNLKNHNESLGAGRYKLYFDLSGVINNDWTKEYEENYIIFYCDATDCSTTGKMTKEFTLHEVKFSATKPELASSPDSSNVTIDYKTEKVTVADGFEASKTANFANKLENGASVTPGEKIYLRKDDGKTAVTEITLASREVIADNAVPTPAIGDDYIRYSDAAFEYKLGEEGEWAALGSWGNLAKDTEYTIYIRRAATDTSFVSEVKEVKVKTTGGAAVVPGGDDEAPKKKGCKSAVGAGSAALGALALTAGATLFLAKKKRKAE